MTPPGPPTAMQHVVRSFMGCWMSTGCPGLAVSEVEGSRHRCETRSKRPQVCHPQVCHPERSAMIRDANGPAESTDPVFGAKPARLRVSLQIELFFRSVLFL